MKYYWPACWVIQGFTLNFWHVLSWVLIQIICDIGYYSFSKYYVEQKWSIQVIFMVCLTWFNATRMLEYLWVRLFRNGNTHEVVAAATFIIIVIVGIIVAVHIWRRRRFGLLKINTTFIYVLYLHVYRKTFRFTSLNKILCGNTIRDSIQKF